MRRLGVLAVLAALVVLLATPVPAGAHGEVAQEPFLRQQTAAFFDVQFSTTSIKQGEDVTITGKVRILDTWPQELAQPDKAYLSVTTPGPVVVMVDREIGGEKAPMSVYVAKGKMYDFKMTVRGRVPGSYHIHPALYVEGAGPLLGPGQWITIEEAPGGFTFPITLLNGVTIPDLQSYQTPFLLGFTFLTMVLGMAWMVYWTVPKPTVTRLAITNLIPSHDIGSDFGLITRRDIRNVSIIAALGLVLLGVGVVYGATNFPITLPPQVIRFEAPALPEPPPFATVRAQQSTYDPQTHALTLKALVTNVGSQPISLQQLTIANHEFVLGSPQRPWQSQLRVEPATPLNPGESREMTFSIVGDLLETDRLIPMGEPFQATAGVLVFGAPDGAKSYLAVRWPLVVSTFSGGSAATNPGLARASSS
ncbi:MAG TPA: methane monooxygenase/ammonia monooxygenase subunit B [Chloroflexota bacterium]